MRLSFTLCSLVFFSLSGCFSQSKDAPAKPAPPAVVTNAPKEAALSTVVLSPEAEQRLGVVVVSVVEKDIKRHRMLGGEVVLPPGQSAAVTAPFNGTIMKPETTTELTPGMIVQHGQVVYRILPMLAVEHEALTEVQQVQLTQSRTALATLQIESQQRVKSAQVELENAIIELKRAQHLFEEKAGSKQLVDTNEAKVKLAQQALEAAKEGARYLEKATLDASAMTLEPLDIKAPLTGVLSNFVSVSGQTVVQGGLLFNVTNMDSLWIRVPVYVGQLREIDIGQSATIREFGRTDLSKGETVTPIIAPPSANPTAATVDLFYELKSPEAWIRPGHKVAVTIPLHDNASCRVVPWSAVVFDIYGGSWVYQRTAPQTYIRKRVEVEFVYKAETEYLAILRNGPEVGSEIVTDGAAEIFGTELGGAK